LVYDILREAPASLATQLQPRTQLFEPLVKGRTRGFVGREFIFQGIDAALGDPNFPSGYVIIRGEPGIGKTALMGQLVKTRGYVHHFNNSLENIVTARDFLANTCAQLIVRYGLSHDALPDTALQNGGFLGELLQEAADQRAPGDRVIILVDALDEAEDPQPPGRPGRRPNRLFLPATLPEGVYFIVTTREQEDYELVVDRPPKEIYLRDDDPQNRDDVRQYVRNFLAEHKDQMVPRLVEWQVDEPDFVKEITDKSEGNFMYVVHVLTDIRDGKLTRKTLDDIRKLPSGLKQYYYLHWHTMEQEDRALFNRLYKPVVCQLAVVREPVSVALLMEWTKLTEAEIKEVIRTWRQYLNEDAPEGGDSLYRIYHASFQKFLSDAVGLKPYDAIIADTALRKINWPDQG
jgi:hypothetical protein